MPRVASCPQCEHDLLVPDDAEPSALVKCPQCRAFFELQHAEARELPAALIVQSHSEPDAASTESKQPPTDDDSAPFAPLKRDREPVAEQGLGDETSAEDVLDFAEEEDGAGHGSASLPAPQLAVESED